MHLPEKWISIRVKLLSIALAAVVGLGGITSVSMLFLYQALIEKSRTNTQHTVQTAYGVLEHFYRRVARGELKPQEAQKQAIEAIGSLRYGKDDYFWINDMHPTMVMHPFKPQLDGKDLSRVKDPSGKRLFLAFVDRVRQDGEGYVEYLWPKPGNTEPVPKISFVKGFSPWGWVVGSGVYIDDVEAAAWQQARSLGLIGAVLLALFIVVIWVISNTITRPLSAMKSVMQQVVADGDLDRSVSVPQRDEVGQMAAAFNALLYQIRRFVVRVQDEGKRLALAGDHLSETGARVSHQMHVLESETTQVATAMTEMAASAEEVARNVESAADHSRATDQEARNGYETVGRNLAASERMAASVREASEKVGGLAEDAANIGSVIDVITSVAEQTNLLALKCGYRGRPRRGAGKGVCGGSR